MAESSTRRKIAVILATDVVGYSTKMEENEDQTLKNLKACRNIIDGLVEEHHGRIFNTAGDSVLVEFQSAVEAVICGSEFQDTIKERNNSVSEEEQMEFRIGINMGDVVIEGDNLYGEGVNIAARLEALAQPGGVCLSKNVHEIVNKKTNFQFHDLGEQTVKNTVLHAVDVTLDGTSQRKLQEPTNEQQSSTEKPPAIAVLPFANMSGDSEQEYFADGITEDIITNLSLWRTFPVISRNSSFTFRGQSQNIKQVANELGARYIVEGSVRKGGNRVRITAQLIDAEEDHHLWSEKWDRTLEDIFDVQDEVSEAIARRVAPSVTGHEQVRLIRKRPKNLSAWEEYLQGLNCYYNEAKGTDYEDPGLTQARQHWEKAIELDPTLSDAYAYLSMLSSSELVQRITKDPEKTLDEIMMHGRKAETLNPENPLALLGIAKCYFFRGDHSTALDYAQRAVQFNPSFALNFYQQGLVQAHIGEYQHGESSILKAFELSPADPELMYFHCVLYFACLGQGRYEEALVVIDKALRQHKPGMMLGFRAAVLGHLERGSEAKAALDRYLALRPNLKTRDDYRRIFVPNSALADPIIEGLVKAGWKTVD